MTLFFLATEAPLTSGFVPGVNGLQAGVVKKLDADPEGQYKIQVSVPVLQAETDGVWARLASFYGSNGIGIQLRVPVFDGFEKRSKIRRAKVEEENARIGYEDALKGMQANYMNAVSEVNNSQRNYKKQFDNYTLAQDVYSVTADQYKEGVGTMTAVLQDEMRMSEAMNNYLTAYYKYKVANLSLLKLTGQLDQVK